MKSDETQRLSFAFLPKKIIIQKLNKYYLNDILVKKIPYLNLKLYQVDCTALWDQMSSHYNLLKYENNIKVQLCLKSEILKNCA